MNKAPFKMDTFFQLKVQDAQRTAKKLRASGEYIWATDWDSYARKIAAYAQDYHNECRRAKMNGKPEPKLELPSQPANLTVEEKNGEQVRRQCTSKNIIKKVMTPNGPISVLCIKRPAMYQGVHI